MDIWLWEADEWDPTPYGAGGHSLCSAHVMPEWRAVFASREEAEAHFRKWLSGTRLSGVSPEATADLVERAISGEEITYDEGLWCLQVEFYTLTV